MLLLVGGSSCIKDEEPNIEVDILEIESPAHAVLNVAYNSGDIDVYVAPGTDIADLQLEFTLSEGATITPQPDEVTDYTEPRTFIVTSEDKKWSKEYIISVRFGNMPLKFGFESWRQPDNKRYQIPYEAADADGNTAELNIWACGNEAYNFVTGKDDDYTKFPTQPTADAYQGNTAAKLVTVLTGQIDRPIASGNLFIGVFDASKRNPLESTQFGLPFHREPLRLTGAYKYRSGGETMVSKEADHGRIQAVLYRTDGNTRYLNGLTLHDSPNVVARAEIAAISDTPGDGFATFDVPFVYTSAYDASVAAAGQYNLTIIFSASRNGDSYDGAAGSTLTVDDVEIICR